MAAFAFTLGVFLYVSVVGLAVAECLQSGRSGLQRLLLSPALGLSTLLLPVFTLNRAGFPVAQIGPFVVFGLGLLALFVLFWRRPKLPWGAMLWPTGILLFAAAAVAWPMMHFGFDWGSFSNDDMANYCLAAQRFLEHGYYELPDLTAYFTGKNYSLAFWYMHVAGGARSGAELMLASLWAVSGLNAHQIFMPTVVALHLALIAATAAAVAGVTTGAKRHRAVNITLLLMAVSPLTALGTLYQLIAQVGGLALMMVALILLCQPLRRSLQSNLRSGGSISLLMSALFIWYPETLPFLGAAWLIWFAVLTRQCTPARRLAFLRRRLIFAGCVLLALTVILNSYLLSVYVFMEGQARQGLNLVDTVGVVFPYYLIPSGFGNFWGLLPISSLVNEPFLSAAIVLGVLLSGYFLVCAYRQARRGLPVAAMAFVMLAVGAVLFYRSNDFGLFKLAMYLQPTVAAILGCACVYGARRRLSLAIVLVLCMLQLPSQFAYARRSLGNGAGGLTEIPYVSQNALPRQFDAFMQSLAGSHPDGYYADSSNVVIAKLQSLYSQGNSLIFPSKDFYWGSDRLGDIAKRNGYGDFWSLSRARHETVLVSRELHLSPTLMNRFGVNAQENALPGKRVLIANSPQHTIFNRFFARGDEPLFRVEDTPKNHLIFISSALGPHYYQPAVARKKVAFYQLEHDPMFPGRQIAGVGQHMLLLAAGVTPRPRLLFEISTTVLGQNEHRLPVPVVNGQSNQVAPFVGRGSGRLLTPPLEPIIIDGLPYFHIDFGREGKLFMRNRGGTLMSLYGARVDIDPRYLTAFARNISLLSEAEANALFAPNAISKFPDDLKSDSLQYSGLYEDGWVSERAFVMLTAASESNTLVIKGMVPLIADPAFHSVLTVLLDGDQVAQQRLTLGSYEIKVPIGSAAGQRKVELVFDGYQVLPGGDGRPTGGMINYLGFKKE